MAAIAALGALVDRPPWVVTTGRLFDLPPSPAFAVGLGLLAGVAWTVGLSRIRAPEPVDDGSFKAARGLLFALAAAVSEELLFRGAASQLLWGGIVGAVVSSLAFALVHDAAGPARARLWAVYGAFGLAQCALMVATGSLLAPLVCHAFVNVATVTRLRSASVAA